jgi:hypothetical protein
MDNFLLNRMITPEADKPAGGGQDSRQWIVKKETGNNLLNINRFYELYKNPFKDTISVCAFFLTIPKPLKQHPI